MKNFDFWQKWLSNFSIFLVTFGLVLAFFNQSTLMDIAFNNQIDPVFWQGQSIPESALTFQAWIYGVLGAVIAGWGIFITFLANHPFKAREPWAWYCLALSIVTWFVIDTAISAFYQVTFNALFNVVFLFLAGIPLLFTRKYFLQST